MFVRLELVHAILPRLVMTTACLVAAGCLGDGDTSADGAVGDDTLIPSNVADTSSTGDGGETSVTTTQDVMPEVIGPIACADDSTCPSGTPMCDPIKNRCVECIALLSCGQGRHCIDGQCSELSGPFCLLDDDCASESATPHCDTRQRVCVECVVDWECGADELCIGNRCQDSPSCDGESCPLGRRTCTDKQLCAECADDVHCEGPQNKCISHECVDTDSLIPYSYITAESPTQRAAFVGPVVACDSDAECEATGRICDPIFGRCVECFLDEQCAGTDRPYCRSGLVNEGYCVECDVRDDGIAGCPAPYVCNQDACVQPDCTPGQSLCTVALDAPSAAVVVPRSSLFTISTCVDGRFRNISSNRCDLSQYCEVTASVNDRCIQGPACTDAPGCATSYARLACEDDELTLTTCPCGTEAESCYDPYQ